MEDASRARFDPLACVIRSLAKYVSTPRTCSVMVNKQCNFTGLLRVPKGYSSSIPWSIYAVRGVVVAVQAEMQSEG